MRPKRDAELLRRLMRRVQAEDADLSHEAAGLGDLAQTDCKSTISLCQSFLPTSTPSHCSPWLEPVAHHTSHEGRHRDLYT